MKLKWLWQAAGAALCILGTTVRADHSLVEPPLAKVKPVAPMAAHVFDVRDVRLLDGPFKAAMERDREYLLSFEVDRLLHTFRLNAALPSTATPLGGWEEPKCELRGHFAGHYLTACALMFGSTGDRRLKAKVDALVAGLGEVQRELSGGYLSAFPESFFDRVERQQPVWAPYYTLHKIYAGLLDAYVYCGNTQALEMCRKFGDWAIARNAKLTDEQMQKMLGNEHGGMNEALANLYALTGEAKYLEASRRFNHRTVIDPAARGEDRLNGLHANTQIPKFVGTARQYELTGDPGLKAASVAFWQFVARDRSYVIGGHSDREHFFPVHTFEQHLGVETAETCNTYNMLKLTRHLFAWEPTVETMDFYERALYNHILASQDPRRGMLMYLVPMKPGHFKSYSTPLDSFWCCVGTGVENHAKYTDSIYAHAGDTLYVNLFIPSELAWKDKRVIVRQQTRFPESDQTTLTVRCGEPTRFTLRVRWPAWADSIELKVNGQALPVAGAPGKTYLPIDREWRDGDRLEVRLPLRLRTEPLPHSQQYLALLYGPIVLAGELGTAGVEQLSPYVKGQLDLARHPIQPSPVFVTDTASVLDHVQAVPDTPLTFQTKGLGRPRDVRLVPFYQLHHQRYALYWPVYTRAAWQKLESERRAEADRLKALAARTVDLVEPGNPASEQAHGLKGERTQAGPFNERFWRHATDGGWFAWDLQVEPDRPQELWVTYWGSDGGNRVFDIQVEDKVLATVRLEPNRPDQFFDATYPLPADLVRGKNRVTVRFQAKPGAFAGGVFGVRVVRSE